MRRCFPVLVLLVLASCSVKEDRSGCPCRLEIIFTGEMAFPEVVLSATAGEALRLSETVRVKESGPVHEILVPRGMVSLSALAKVPASAQLSALAWVRALASLSALAWVPASVRRSVLPSALRLALRSARP